MSTFNAEIGQNRVQAEWLQNKLGLYMNNISLGIFLACSLSLLSACSTIGSVAGAVIANKTGNNALIGSAIGGAIGQRVGNQMVP